MVSTRGISTGVGAGQVDKSTRMSVLFSITVDNQRADQQMKSVDDALARIIQLNRQNYENRSRRSNTTTSPGTSPNSKFDNGPMQVAVGDITGRIEGQVEDIMADAMKTGADFTKQWLRAAVTPYGRYRVSKGQGNGPGRDDDGDMIKAVTWNVGKTLKNRSRGSRGVGKRGSRVTGGSRRATFSGFFGWDEPEVYMVAQEKGFNHANAGRGTSKPRAKRAYVVRKFVPGALSLGSAMLPTRQYLLERLRAIKV